MDFLDSSESVAVDYKEFAKANEQDLQVPIEEIIRRLRFLCGSCGKEGEKGHACQ